MNEQSYVFGNVHIDADSGKENIRVIADNSGYVSIEFGNSYQLRAPLEDMEALVEIMTSTIRHVQNIRATEAAHAASDDDGNVKGWPV